MTTKRTAWVRETFEGVPIYVHPDRPDWFVPNREADRVLRQADEASAALGALRRRLPDDTPIAYDGRAAVLGLDRLAELWIHLTDRCNLACGHCLFASSPSAAPTLSRERVAQRAREASALGARVFALTGGEPTIHDDFVAIVDDLLTLPESHVVVLTNGSQFKPLSETLGRWPKDRVFWQISLDGPEPTHDAVRGEGHFGRLRRSLRTLREHGWSFTVATTIMASNAHALSETVQSAHDLGASALHFMWYVPRGRGTRDGAVTSAMLFPLVRQAVVDAEALGMTVDNVDALRTQVFSPAGTIHDGTGSGWDSIALGPDDALYPSASLVGIPALATPISADLASAWRESEVLRQVRERTVAGGTHVWRRILGGGDIDHVYTYHHAIDGADPLVPLFELLAKWLIVDEARSVATQRSRPALHLKMGDILERCGAHGHVATAHSNCLLGVARPESTQVVKDFYTDAALTPRIDIRNPSDYPSDALTHVPSEAQLRAYGCGSPVMDADISAGETVLDVGSGAGLECFIAASMVGRTGRVIGVDMLDAMLEIAERGRAEVAQRLGYDVVQFAKGEADALPVEDASVDVILSNCVLNLAKHKRRVWRELLRVLKPGGRVVVADVASETDPPPSIRNDEALRGECIGGALAELDLLALMREVGFAQVRVLKRFPYRVVDGHPFYSITVEAGRPSRTPTMVRAIYRGPGTLSLENGIRMPTGAATIVPVEVADALGASVFVLNDHDEVTNLDLGDACCVLPSGDDEVPACDCSVPPESVDAPPPSPRSAEAPSPTAVAQRPAAAPYTSNASPTTTRSPQKIVLRGAGGTRTPKGRHAVGCMRCGAELTYHLIPQPQRCVYCDREVETSVWCESEHFVCDACHTGEALDAITSICVASDDRDLVDIYRRVREHPAIPIHGPQYHAMVPGVILAGLRNAGLAGITDAQIKTAVTRGGQVPGGFCGFFGACGAALGAGAAISVVTASSPMQPERRQHLQQIVPELARTMGEYTAARCCQRDSWLVLRGIAERSEEVFGVALSARDDVICGQMGQNKECITEACPLHPRHRGRA